MKGGGDTNKPITNGINLNNWYVLKLLANGRYTTVTDSWNYNLGDIVNLTYDFTLNDNSSYDFSLIYHIF